MILNEIDGMRLVSRKLLFFEEAYVERGTNLLFIPLVDDVWVDKTTGKFTRILANKLRRVNVKTLSQNYRRAKTTWSVLVSADADTMVIK